MKLVKTLLFSLFGLMLINTGLNKLFQYIPVPEGLPEAVVRDDAAMAEIEWLLPLIAVVEVAGGLLVLFPRTRALGALMVFPVLVGVLLSHLFVYPAGLPMALVFWAVLIWMLIDNRHKLLPLVS